ncbi:MAG: alkaline phosphatase family protein [Rhodobacteraceae bacterium]|nr:alkaline phosphatase family protein [Paracoccaceae bacterium]
MNQPMNVLFVTVDQWRGDCLSAQDHPVVKTPNLDALAADGVLFANHFGQCAPCGPSRASLLTGMYAMNHRSVRNGTPLDARFTNIALEARAKGYTPGLIGYTDTSHDPRQYPSDDPVLKTTAGTLHGFDQLVPGSEAGCDGVKLWIEELAAKGYPVPSAEIDIYNPLVTGETAQTLYRSEDSDTAFIIDHAVTAIETQKTAPWFLHLSLLRPHPPFIASAPYNTMYPPDDMPDPCDPEAATDHPFLAFVRRHHLDLEGLDQAGHQADPAAMRQLRATYYGLISEVDHHLGRLIGYLKETGQYDSTLIVFTSDHGEQLWDHGVLGKEHFYDQSYHIPLIIKQPGSDMARGRVVTEFTEAIDLMSTVLDVIEQEIPPQCDGHSLRPFLQGETPGNWRTEVCWELDFRDNKHGIAQQELGLGAQDCSLCVIRDARFKYVHFGALPPLFFDLVNDPDELHNLAGDPAYAPQILTYAQKMLSWRLAHADRTLTGLYLSADGPKRAMP